MNNTLAGVAATAALFGFAGVVIYATEGPTTPRLASEALFVALLGFAIAGILLVEALLGERSEESEESDFSKEIEERT